MKIMWSQATLLCRLQKLPQTSSFMPFAISSCLLQAAVHTKTRDTIMLTMLLQHVRPLKTRNLFVCLAFCIPALGTAQTTAQKFTFNNTALTFEQRVTDLVSRMTL